MKFYYWYHIGWTILFFDVMYWFNLDVWHWCECAEKWFGHFKPFPGHSDWKIWEVKIFFNSLSARLTNHPYMAFPNLEPPLPHRSFLATRLLPCGRLDGKVRKFTGNDELGPASDATTMVVHSFAHFSLLYSKGHIVFCDLQGKGVLALECWTGGWVGRSAAGRKKKFWNPL